MGTVEQTGWVTAMRVAGRGAPTAPGAVCISGVRDTSLCPEQALLSLSFTEMHRDLIGCRAGTLGAKQAPLVIAPS